jgi:hypothetical protein
MRYLLQLGFPIAVLVAVLSTRSSIQKMVDEFELDQSFLTTASLSPAIPIFLVLIIATAISLIFKERKTTRPPNRLFFTIVPTLILFGVYCCGALVAATKILIDM